ncbi:MAG: hypothetical protein R6U70_03730 [Bacillota bacterium]
MRAADGRSHRIWERIQPVHVFGLAAAYLAFAWLISYLGDVHNVLALTDRLINRGAERPFMWYYLFTEGSPTEMLQWSYLTATVVFCGYLIGQLAERGHGGAARFFILMAVGTGIMLMEDAGNIRHRIKYYIRLTFGDTMLLGIAVELVIYALLGALMIYALARFWRYPWRHRETRYYLISGYLLYAAASIASATRHIGDWYDHAGHWLLRACGLFEPFTALFTPTDVGRPIGFYIMDFLVEESVELIGAGALCTAVFAYIKEIRRNPGIAQLDDED